MTLILLQQILRYQFETFAAIIKINNDIIILQHISTAENSAEGIEDYDERMRIPTVEKLVKTIKPNEAIHNEHFGNNQCIF